MAAILPELQRLRVLRFIVAAHLRTNWDFSLFGVGIVTCRTGNRLHCEDADLLFSQQKSADMTDAAVRKCSILLPMFSPRAPRSNQEELPGKVEGGRWKVERGRRSCAQTQCVAAQQKHPFCATVAARPRLGPSGSCRRTFPLSPHRSYPAPPERRAIPTPASKATRGAQVPQRPVLL